MKHSKNTYLEQIDNYYNRKLKSYSLIELGMTPKCLVEYGVPELPLVMRQGTLTKCVRKPTGSRSAHELPRNVIESLPEQIENPIFLIKDKARNSIALISDSEDRNKNKILIAILLDSEQHANRVNEVKSIYGKTNLKDYLTQHINKQELYVVENKKAEILSRVIGLQLPKALITSSYNQNIASENQKVNHNFKNAEKKDSVIEKLREYNQSINKAKENAQPVKVNNLEHQRDPKER